MHILTMLKQTYTSTQTGEVTKVAITQHPVLMESVLTLPADVRSVLTALAPPWDGSCKIDPPVSIKAGQVVNIIFDTATRSARVEIAQSAPGHIPWPENYPKRDNIDG